MGVLPPYTTLKPLLTCLAYTAHQTQLAITLRKLVNITSRPIKLHILSMSRCLQDNFGAKKKE